MIDLTTRYMNMELESPLVCSSSPLCDHVDNIRQMADAGAGAVVLQSLFEEQLVLESLDLERNLERNIEQFAESLSYFPELEDYHMGPKDYLEHIGQAKAAVDIPILGSLNGVTLGGWIDCAAQIQDAGADGLELNLYDVPADPNVSGAELEQKYVELVEAVKAKVSLPVAVKLGPGFTAPVHVAKKLVDAGADALVLFNRFYQPDMDLENREVVPNLALSTPQEVRLRLRWTAIMFDKVDADLAVTGGVHTGEDALKVFMAGGRVAMMTSALLKHGIDHLKAVRTDLIWWMERHEYNSIKELQGVMSMASVADPAAFARANYMNELRSYSAPKLFGAE